jgi:lipoate-protein ligase A
MIIQTLKEFHVKNLSIMGISDIVLGDKKICGSSLHRKKDTLLYQGSLLLGPDIQIFDRYLKHPMKEPDYRKGRKHQDFITSLWEEGYRIDKQDLISALKSTFAQKIPWSVQ